MRVGGTIGKVLLPEVMPKENLCWLPVLSRDDNLTRSIPLSSSLGRIPVKF